MTFKVNDRMVLQADLNYRDTKIPSGTVCTLVSEEKNDSKDEVLILRCGYNEKTDTPIVIGTAKSFLRKATKEELENSNYKNLVSKNFWVDESFKTGYNTTFEGIEPGTIGKIVNFELSDNESRDILVFNFGDSKNYRFERNFVETYFNKYDEEIENMLGEEIIMKDMPRNYFLSGARMIFDKEVVILQEEDKESGLYEIETMSHEKLKVEKEKLSPITNAEQIFAYKEEDIVQESYRVGNALFANENIKKHLLLNQYIKPLDLVEILHVDNANINVNEDVYQIVIGDKFESPVNVSYSDLKNFFTPFDKYLAESKDLDFSVFENNSQEKNEHHQEEQQEEVQEEIQEEQINVPIRIHELSILGFRFKIDDENYDKFNIDGQEKFYDFNDIDLLITALNELKKLDKKN